jgi:GTPase SAR1 family protein
MSDPGAWTTSEELPTRIFAHGKSGEDALSASVRAVLDTLRGLAEHENLLGTGELHEIKATVAQVEERLARQRLQVVVVGERGSGKSTLLDAIVGDRLLSGARGQSKAVARLERCPVPTFRARFESGKVDDFSARTKDTAGERARAAEELARALDEAEQRCRAQRLELRRAIEAKERADLDAERARSGVAGARELEGVTHGELNALEDDAGRLDRGIGELELRLPPSARTPPPRWAVWWWLVHALSLLFRRSAWRRYRSLTLERAQLHERLSARRLLAREAAEARALAEAGLEPLGSGADQARTHSGEVEQALREAEAARDRLRGELEVLRSELEHHQSERFRQFFAELQALSHRTDLVEIAIDYPAKLLPEDVTIVDIPGLVSEAAPEWQLIREQADGCILVSELDRAVSEGAKRFLRQLREVVPHLLLVLTKMDQAFQEARRRGAEEPWNEVELARRIGTRRFARELGRDPNSVLSIAVAAESALLATDSELVSRFDEEVEKLFLLLRRERALIVGARAADALRRCVAGFADAEARAEAAYRNKITALERQRTPEPDVFKQQLLSEVEPALEAAANEATEHLSTSVENGFLLLRRLCEQEVDACATRSGLVDLAERLARDLPERIEQLRQEIFLELDSNMDRQLAKLEQGLFQAVRTRYQLLHEIRRLTGSSPSLIGVGEAPVRFETIASEMSELLVDFRKGRLTLGLSGSVAGAAGAAIVHPWASLAGAAFGALLALARREGALRQQALVVLTRALGKQELEFRVELEALVPRVAASLRTNVERSLERALLHFARWIAEPLEAERQLIERERQKLVQLETLRDRVSACDRDLESSLKAATLISAGLCR